MKADQMLPGRRSVLRIAACLGAAVTMGTLFTERDRSPGREASPGPAAGPRAAAAGPPMHESAYRLRPMTADAPPRFHRALPPVRTRPFERFPQLGRTLVLTFDDGPDPHYTPGILSTLRQYHVNAMFFVCGEMAAANRELLREIADDGHVVGNHTWSHPLIPKLPASKIRGELGRTSEVIARTLGAAPLWFRAPYGAWNKLTFEIGAELGMEPVGWTVDSLDWTEPGTTTIVRKVLDGAAPGAVILSHDAGGNRSQSVAALRRYLPRLLDAGYRITVPHR
ncbi:peptidoglycan/xylan/chitin deacetylase (PgdA/CDA1 family) [Streptomyces sp. SLBN-118]|uniref:polysaccharide deacetylase family protein n=1 Tax=Streptomyces sp. SLBN-118 TaxID=2768454 RepID=UPI0011523110|nr:polysaccharide deacetylase family protein [Streptomyces sp. SLBN-118]TQK50590.1 peptidoglycan/xylan/chitin deacetylase (PgdA/CDA1 family) [Streptomyces sp. SLBN-118]